jgi:hypothetical protein
MSEEKNIVEVDISGDCPFCHEPRRWHSFLLGGLAPMIVCESAPNEPHKINWRQIETVARETHRFLGSIDESGAFILNGKKLPVLFGGASRGRMSISEAITQRYEHYGGLSPSVSWTCGNHTEPIVYTLGQTVCEVCGRAKP